MLLSSYIFRLQFCTLLTRSTLSSFSIPGQRKFIMEVSPLCAIDTQTFLTKFFFHLSGGASRGGGIKAMPFEKKIAFSSILSPSSHRNLDLKLRCRCWERESLREGLSASLFQTTWGKKVASFVSCQFPHRTHTHRKRALTFAFWSSPGLSFVWKQT